MRNLSAFIIPLLILSGCSTTNIVTINVTEPAPVTMPGNIKSVGIINRNSIAPGNSTLDQADRILSLEGKNLDKDGAERSIEGLQTELTRNPRFTSVKYLRNENVEAGSPGMFPAAMTWEKAEQICKRNNVDALYVLENYDTDTKADYTTVPVTIKGPLGVEVPAIEHHVTITTFIKTGWRIYDVTRKQIIDEHSVTKSTVSKGQGINPVTAVSAVKGRKENVLSISNDIGSDYAEIILPYQSCVRRNYYVKGSNNFEIAKRKAQTGKWDEAANYWKQEVNNPKAKIAGRANYNMAIIHEINGELDQAITWARESYENYNNKSALYYVNILRDRKSRIEELKMQQQLTEEAGN